jgi:hypothetical protein
LSKLSNADLIPIGLSSKIIELSGFIFEFKTASRYISGDGFGSQLLL